MGKTSTAAKARYNKKAYDSITFRVKKGQKEVIKIYTQSINEGLNSFICRAINETMQRDREKQDSNKI